MTKVRMLVGLSGPAGFFDVGDTYECDESEAARLIGARFALPWVETATVAVPAPPEPVIERAVVSAPEKRAKRKK